MWPRGPLAAESIMENAMLNANIQSGHLRQPQDACVGSRRAVLGNRKLWLALGAVVLIAGLA